MNVLTIGVKLKEERNKTVFQLIQESKIPIVATIGMCEPKVVLISAHLEL